MNKIITLYSLSFIVLFFTACGGGGGGSSAGESFSGISTKSVSGNVVDPEIVGARVSLICGSKTYYSSSTTDNNGAFVINGISSSIDLSQCIFNTSDGNDGDDFSGLTLTSAYKLFNSNNNILITPLTTIITNDSDFDTNLETVKTKVAAFLGLTTSELLTNPIDDLDVARVGKKLTKIALTKTSSGANKGYLNLNDTSITQSTLDDYITADLLPTLSVDDQTKLSDDILGINNATSIDDIAKNTVTNAVIYDLYTLYNQSSYSGTLKINIEILAEKIVIANKNNDKYKSISSYQLRKALSDLSLSPSFSDATGEILESTLSTKLSSASFESDIDWSLIDIKDIKGLIFIDSSNYKMKVGNNSIARRYYYTFSDKSNLAKALTLIKSTTTDDVNDPISEQIAIGLAKYGFYEESIDYIEQNVYQSGEKQEAFKALAVELLTLEQKEYAAKALTKSFNILKESLKSSLSTTNTSLLQYIIRYMAESGYQNDGDAILGVNSMLDYLNDIKGSFNSKYSDFQKITTLIDNISVNTYFYNDNLSLAKNIFSRDITYASEMPLDNRGALYALYRIAIEGTVFGLDGSGAVNIAKNSTYSSYLALSSTYGYYTVAYDALSGNLDTAISNFNSLSSSRQRSALTNGMGAGLFLNGNKDELFNDYYNISYYSDSKKDTLLKDTTTQKGSAIMTTAMMIHILGGDSELEDYLDRLHTLSKTWTKYSDSDDKNIYASWGSSETSRYGYLSMADMYKRVGNDTKAKTLITESIERVKGFTTIDQKIEAFGNILDVISYLKYDDSFNKSEILTELFNAAQTSSLTEIEDIIKVANILSSNDRKSDAITLVNRAYSLVTTLISGDLTNVQDRSEYLIGKYSSSSRNFDVSIANGYYQAGDSTKAKEIIQESLSSMNTLNTSTVDYYDLLISLVSAYGHMNDVNSVETYIAKIGTSKERSLAYVEASKALINYDAFIGTNIASVDSDGDGKPDFFNLGVTSEQITDSSLELDDDIDGDGILDTDDELPYDGV